MMTSAVLRASAYAFVWGSGLVAAVPERLTARALQTLSTPSSGLSLTAKLASERYCTADDEVFTYRVDVVLTVHNRTGRPIVIPRDADGISRVFLAKDVESLRTGELETDLNLTITSSGGGSLTAANFIEVLDGAAHQFGTIRTLIPMALVQGRPPGVPTTGPHEMSFVLDLWRGSQQDEDRWRRRFGRRLWTESLVTQPIHVVIPEHPTVAHCK